MISLLTAIWGWCGFVKDVISNYMVGRGFRWSSGSFVCSIAISVYTFLAWMVSQLFNAISDLCTQLPQAVGEVSDALTVSKAGLAGASSLGSNFLAMVNYILPLDFMASCICIYFSVWLACWVLGVMFKFFDFLSDVNPIG